MSFADIIARDFEFIARDNGEFGVDVDYWEEDSDTEGLADEVVRGVFFRKPSDRTETMDGQSAKDEISVLVKKADLATVEPKGHIAISGIVYSIQHVSETDGGTWKIHACREDVNEYGIGTRLYM